MAYIRKEKKLKINIFLGIACKREKSKKEIDIAQASSLFKEINKMLWGIPYLMIKIGFIRIKTNEGVG